MYLFRDNNCLDLHFTQFTKIYYIVSNILDAIGIVHSFIFYKRIKTK